MATRALLAAVLLVLAVAPSAVGSPPPRASASIVGGQGAAIADWPSIAFILTAWDTDGDPQLEAFAQCTGTVIAPEWVISAAHCAFQPNGQGIDALLTVTGISDLNDDGEAIAADRLVVHPAWDPDFLVGDALLIHLESPSSAPPHAVAQPGVQYSSPPDVPNAAGWGAVDEDAEVGTEVLQEAWLEIQDDATCDAYTTHLPSQTCAGTMNVAGACKGDSGGPLLAFDGDRPVLYGLTSYGPQIGLGLSVCSLQAPAVFSRVPAFATFIAQTVNSSPTPPTTQPGGGTTTVPPGPVPSAPDATPPVLSRARLSSDVLRIGRRITLSFRLSEAAVVTTTVLKQRAGRYRRLSPTLQLAANAGTFRRRFSGRLGARRLKPGRYRFRLKAIDAAGNAARPVTLSFRIVR